MLLGDDGGSHGRIHDNWVINTANYGVAIVGGSNNHLYGNRVVSDGKAGNTAVSSTFAEGIALWDASGTGGMSNDTAHDNAAALVRPDGRADWWMPACNPSTACTGNMNLPISTGATEQAERDASPQRWQPHGSPSAPTGEEAQINYVFLGSWLDPSPSGCGGCAAFVMVLAWSRHVRAAGGVDGPAGLGPAIAGHDTHHVRVRQLNRHWRDRSWDHVLQPPRCDSGGGAPGGRRDVSAGHSLIGARGRSALLPVGTSWATGPRRPHPGDRIASRERRWPAGTQGCASSLTATNTQVVDP